MFVDPLHRGILVQRYKRFFADIVLETGEAITAHCPNSGALLGVTTPGTPVWVSHNPSPTRKLSYTWQMAWIEDTYVGVNTSWPNILVENALREGRLAPFKNYPSWRREVPYGPGTRFDFLLGTNCYVEVKNVHLKRGDIAVFPDCVTTRGAKHLRELTELVQQGFRAAMVYVIQRADCQGFGFASDLDPAYAAAALTAQQAGVEFYAYACEINPQGIRVQETLLSII